ncbi:MAG TPA: amidohydrolase family protein, partial [Candidatus Limnocylindria bacterium]|nr:amidohydrolase family protein [Candidatus Limnocylindria bacterium]
AGALTASDVLFMATRGGAQALRLDDVGSIHPGARADLVIIDGERLALGGEPATRIVFGGGSRAVRDVIVNGEALVRDGRPTRYDPAEVLAHATEQRTALSARAALT